MIDKERVKAAVRELLFGIGENPERKALPILPAGL